MARLLPGVRESGRKTAQSEFQGGQKNMDEFAAVRNRLTWMVGIVARFAFAGALLGMPAATAAQEPEVPAREPTCSWDACALRVEGGQLIQGIRGQPRGRIAGIDLDVEILAAGPDSAAAYAARFSVARPESDLWSTFGDLGRGLALAAWIHFALADDAADGWAWTAAALMPVSQSARAHARRQDVIATRALDRAVWWYNRELATPPTGSSVPPVIRMRPLPADRSFWDLAPLAGGIVGGLATSLLADDVGWIVTGVLFGTSLGDGVARRRLAPD
jgi:hypothetical protein